MFSENVGQNLFLEMAVAYIKKGYNIASVLLALPLHSVNIVTLFRADL